MLVTLVLRLCDELALCCQIVVELCQLGFQSLVFPLDELHFFPHVSDNLDSHNGLLSEFMHLLISFLNLLIQSLVFDLQLFKVNHVQVLGKFILFAKILLNLCLPILERDIRTSHLFNLCVLIKFELFNLLDNFLRDFPARASIFRVLRYLPFELLERVPALHSLLSLCVQLTPQLLAHFGIPQLLDSKLHAFLIHLCEGILILVLGDLPFGLLFGRIV
mmetsp:Transcript_132435/g.264239  ORF Transcript_132435/g.264239 Transcript_132435/m.264239 type:complete len:219 (-) Transcript_132435:498-1154(-)